MKQKIAIHSVPRSGSTWLGNIFNSHHDVSFSYQPLFSYVFKDYLNENSSLKEIERFFKEISLSDDDFIRQKDGVKKGIIPRFEKNEIATHICYKEVRYHHILPNLLKKCNDIKVIGLIRSPFATIYSWLNAPKEFRPDLGWKIEDEWKLASKKNNNRKEEYNGYVKWKEVAFLFLELKQFHPENFYLINYDELLSNTHECVEKLFHFCNLKLEKQTLEFIYPNKKINQADAYSVFKTKSSDDAWANKLPQFIIDEIRNDKEFIQLNEIFKWI